MLAVRVAEPGKPVKWGVIGLSREPDLMNKDVKFDHLTGAVALRVPLPSWLRRRRCLACSTAFLARTPPLPCVCTAFVAETPPLPCVFHCRCG